jgi:hypothetical protein
MRTMQNLKVEKTQNKGNLSFHHFLHLTLIQSKLLQFGAIFLPIGLDTFSLGISHQGTIIMCFLSLAFLSFQKIIHNLTGQTIY